MFHVRRSLTALCICLAIATCGLTAGSRLQGGTPQPAAPPDLDTFVAQVMTTFEVPGIAVAIVKDGQVVVARGYGVRKLGESAPVDAQTRFGIASNTKVFTATSLGLLVEEGKLGWDAPVVQYLPWFQMWDPYVTREMTVRDLLVHRSGLGLGAGDLLWWPASTYDRKEIARRLRFIQPATSFRSAYVKARAQAQARVAAAEKQAIAARNAASKPSLPLAQYAGTYNDAWYGDIEIASENGRLVMKFSHTPELVGDLGHWQYDTFVVRWRDRELRADAYVTFALDSDGRIDQAKMRAVSPATDFSFDFQDLLLRPVRQGKATAH
jgi:hypothetical protein